MTLRKSIGVMTLLLGPALLAGCETGNMRTAEYYGVPYCCDRTAPPGVAMYEGRANQRMARQTTVTETEEVTRIEPAAGPADDRGDRVFRDAVRKR